MGERQRIWARRFDWLVLVAAAFVIPVVVIEQADPDETLKTIAGIANWAIWLIFLAEVVFMLAIVEDRRRWLRENPLDVAIVVLTPPFLPASLQALRVFRLLRLLRVLRVLQAARRLFTPTGLRWAGLLALVTLFCGGAGFAAVEQGVNEDVDNTWDGLWWAVCTMTTVGYGDIGPETESGRMIAIVVMLVGIGFLTMLIAAAAERFVSLDVREEVAEVEDELASAEADILRELGDISERLRRVESSVRNLRAT